MRIVFLSTVGDIGGAERSLLDLIASLRESHPAWDLQLITGNSGTLVKAVEAIGVRVHVLSLPPKLARIGDAGAGPGRTKVAMAFRLASVGAATLRYVRSLRSLLLKLNPDIVHSNGFKMHILAARATPAGVPLVWHIHDYLSSRPFMRRLMRLQSHKCSAAIANSDSVVQDFQLVCGPALKVYRVWNAVDLSEYSPEGPKLDLDEACDMNAPDLPLFRVGLVATFARWKGHEVFLKALAMLPPDLPMRGYIVGGPVYQTEASQWYMEELRQIANNLGLKGKVGFSGFISRPAEAMRALDVVVHASTEREPFGLVIIEAMACGKPVITSRFGGSAEITEDNSGAIACSPGDPASLANQIVSLLQDPNLRKQLSASGRSHAKTNFDRVHIGPACAVIYQSLARPDALSSTPVLLNSGKAF